MLKIGTQNLSGMYVGGQKIKKAFVGTELVFDGVQTYTVHVTASDSALGSLLNAGTLTVADETIKGETTTVITKKVSIEVSFILSRKVSIPRSVSVNGIDIGHVGAAGDSVSTTVSVSDGMTIAIEFTEYVPSYTITTDVDPSGAGTVTGAGTYRRGTSVTVTAVPADGYTFSGWKNGSTTVSTNASYTFTVTANVTLTAAFAVASRLPAGYTEVEYISPPDSTYNYGGIPLHSNNVNFGTNTTITVEFMPSGTAYSNVWRSTNNYNFLLMSSDTKMSPMMLSNTSKVITTAVSLANKKITFTANYKDQFLTVQAGTYSNSFNVTRGTFTGNTIIYLGSNASTGKCCTGRYYSAKILNGTIRIADCVPCVNSSGDVGMFNLVTNTFHKAIYFSSYKWTAGPAV